jgi:putative ABC transport system permease protein
VRREYRHTYRASLAGTERLVRGHWWAEADSIPGTVRVSAEEGVARSLGVDVGDRITWDVQGVTVESVITSIRAVEWTRFETNFFFVFEPAALAGAPQSWVALARIGSAAARADVQRELVLANPNVSVIDLAVVLDALNGIIRRVALAVRFMALFSVISGIVVLVAALAAGRFARVRETALLRTIGARNRQVRLILLTEYAALGALAGLTGALLGGIAGFLLVHFLYRLEFRLPLAALLAAWGAAVLLSVVIGSLLGRDALRRPPLATLREAGG